MSLKVGILGATGMVGQRFVQFLDGHPQFELGALFASPNSAGKEYGKVGKWAIEAAMPEDVALMEVEATTAQAVLKSGVALVFSALPSAVAGEVESEIAEAGVP